MWCTLLHKMRFNQSYRKPLTHPLTNQHRKPGAGRLVLLQPRINKGYIINISINWTSSVTAEQTSSTEEGGEMWLNAP